MYPGRQSQYYIRWGKSICPDTEGTQLLYSGMVGGANYLQTGGGANHNYLCLPDEPEFLDVVPGLQNARSRISGAEYELFQSPGPEFDSIHNNNIPLPYVTHHYDLTR